MRNLIILFGLLMPTAAIAADNVALTSEVFVEKTARDAQGRTVTTLQEPKVVVPGDKLVFMLKYKNQGAAPATNFVLTNPLPEAVAFQGTSDAGAEVSVDGGKSWGQLATLTVKAADGSLRPAQTADVTHVRWAVKSPIPAGAQGKLSFRGVVK